MNSPSMRKRSSGRGGKCFPLFRNFNGTILPTGREQFFPILRHFPEKFGKKRIYLPRSPFLVPPPALESALLEKG